MHILDAILDIIHHKWQNEMQSKLISKHSKIIIWYN